MNSRRARSPFPVVLLLAAASPALGLSNRVFVSQRSGNDASSCDNILTPCQTFAGAVIQLNPGGEVIVLDSGGYGAVTITQAVTIEAPSGVTAFVHPPSGDAITILAGSTDIVTLRGLVLNSGTGNGIRAVTVGTLNVENCSISGFSTAGIFWISAGLLNVTGTTITANANGVQLVGGGPVQAAFDHCHLDGNNWGFYAGTGVSGSSSTTATYTTANNNNYGWVVGNSTPGKDVVILEFCSGSENHTDGLFVGGTNALSATRYSNCVFANNGAYGVEQINSAKVHSRGDNSITGNGSGATNGTIGSFAPM